MSVDSSIENFHSAYEEGFSEPTLPPGWEDQWIKLSSENPRSEGLSSTEKSLATETQGPRIDMREIPPRAPTFEEEFPGAPAVGKEDSGTPLGRHGLYLPFHLYRNRNWGIYLVAAQVKKLAQDVFEIAGGPLTFEEALDATRLYLYEHRYFHHKAETFSTRLEVSHRKKIYLEGQLPLHAETKGSEDHLEEALAEAYALKTVKKRLKNVKKWGWPSQKRQAFADAIVERINQPDREYERGSEILEEDRYHSVRNRFAEMIFARSPVHVTGRPRKIWSIFKQGFRGLANRLTDFKYLVRKGSPLSDQLELGPTQVGSRP